jgi:hypothetical protein
MAPVAALWSVTSPVVRPTASVRPSGESAAAQKFTASVLLIRQRTLPVAVSCTTIASYFPATTNDPSGESGSRPENLKVAVKDRSSLPVATSQKRMAL